jgi:hypothetical protein
MEGLEHYFIILARGLGLGLGLGLVLGLRWAWRAFTWDFKRCSLSTIISECKCKFKDNIELVYLAFFCWMWFTWFGNITKWGAGAGWGVDRHLDVLFLLLYLTLRSSFVGSSCPAGLHLGKMKVVSVVKTVLPCSFFLVFVGYRIDYELVGRCGWEE